MATKTNGEPVKRQFRGFACMTPEQRRRICRLGGRKTARKHGRKHMSKIGRRGRAQRTKNEKAAKAA